MDDTYSEETGTDHSDGAVFSMDFHNDNSTDDLNEEFKLYVKNVDDPMHFCFKNEGPAQTLRMKIYYNYQESDFSFVSDKDYKLIIFNCKILYFKHAN
ncbi:MAG: hypothetical protein LUF92_15205 [Clostridiales bacterium]|nr:hypothetical protein [Clostridiales bacterium]